MKTKLGRELFIIDKQFSYAILSKQIHHPVTVDLS